MRRSLLSILFVALALFITACAETATRSVATSSPRPRSSVPRAAAMEHVESGTAAPCRLVRRPWGMGCAEEEEEAKASGEYYFYVAVKGARFAPATFSLSPSHQIELDNGDNVVHNITIPAAGLSLDVEVGAEDRTSPITLAPGRYEFFCRIHRASGMRGFFTMTSNKDVVTVRRGY